MDPLAHRSTGIKRARDPQNLVEENSFLKRPFPSVPSPSLSLNMTDNSSHVDIPGFVSLQNEVERLRQQNQILSNQQRESSIAAQQQASAFRSYIDKIHTMEQQLSLMNTVQSENSILKQNNEKLNLELMVAKQQLETLHADQSLDVQLHQSDDSDHRSLKQEYESHIKFARQQRDEANEKLRIERLSNVDKQSQMEALSSQLRSMQMQHAHLTDTLRKMQAEKEMELLQKSSTSSLPSFHTDTNSMKIDLKMKDVEIESLKLEIEELRSMKSGLEVLTRENNRIPELEETIQRLQVENATFESKRMESETLQIQLEASQAVQKALQQKLESLNSDNVSLKQQASSWQQAVGMLSSTRTPEEVVGFVSELQTENQNLLEKVGTLESQLKPMQAQIQSYQSRQKESENAIFSLKVEKSNMESNVHQMQVKISTLNKEIQNLQDLLQSYKLEDDIGGYDTQKTNHISLLESNLQEKNEFIAKLEAEIQEMKKENLNLQKAAKKASDDRVLMEQRIGSGELDSSKTRVLHLSETPTHIWLKREHEMKTRELEHQIQILNDQINVFQQASSSQSNNLNNTTSNSSNHKDNSSSNITQIDTNLYRQLQKELEMLRNSQTSTAKALEGMKSATAVMVRRYMSSVWNIFGWKVEMEEGNRVRIQYKFWNDSVPASKAALLFEFAPNLGQKGVNDRLVPFQLLDTPYSRQIQPEILEILKSQNSLPLFIARLTIHCFEMVASSSTI